MSEPPRSHRSTFARRPPPKRVGRAGRFRGPALLVVAALGVLPSPLAAQSVAQGRRAAPDGTVKITNAAGSVRVIGWGNDSVAVAGTLGDGAERLDFETDPPETRIRVVLPRDPGGRLGASDLVVRVPYGSQVAVRTESATIEAEEVNGGLDLESVSGDIRVRAQSGGRFVYAQSVAGDVEVDAVTKSVRAKSVDGSVTVRRARGYLELSSVSGDVAASGARVWEGEITTVTGGIHFEGSFDPEGSFYFESHGGPIEVTLPPDARLDLEITSFGRVTSNAFAPGETRYVSSPPGARVRIKSFKGDVYVRKAS